MDADTTGLLLFSKDGKLTQSLLSPSSEIPREYKAIVKGVVNFGDLKEKLAKGVNTSDGCFHANLLQSITLPESLAIPDEPPPYSEILLTVNEGKYRMVRRILHNAGHSVLKLHRTKYGDISLGDLKEGELRNCDENELLWANKVY